MTATLLGYNFVFLYKTLDGASPTLLNQNNAMSLKSGTSRPPIIAGNLFNQDHLLPSLLPAEARLFVLVEQIAQTEWWYTISILILVVVQNVIFGGDLIWRMRNFWSLKNQLAIIVIKVPTQQNDLIN